MTKTVKVGVFIGRFQPFHSGHAHVVEQALQKVDHLIILVGSAFRARNTRNPFTFEERKAMIVHSFGWESQSGKLIIEGIPDYPSDDRWEAEVRSTVERILSDSRFVLRKREVFLCGQQKDHSSFYVTKFPEWDPIGIVAENHMISATDFRNRYFSNLPEIVDVHLPKGTVDFLKTFYATPEFKWLLDYNKAKQARDKAWEAAPFPNKDVCADNVVVQSGHVLLVTRGKFPGKGLLALPGGHVEIHQRVRQAAVAELRQETKISDRSGEIPPAMLESYITDYKLFDDPYRSDFGRVISHAFLYRLPEAKPMWRVKGSDDAIEAKWYPVSKLDPTCFHDDHYFIIQELLGL